MIDEAPFVILPVALVTALAWGAHAAWRRSGADARTSARVAGLSALAGVAWMALTWIAASRGILLQWDRTPPPFALLVFSVLIIAAGIAFSPFGGRLAANLPLWVLVGVQGFRLPLEIAMHRLYERGVMPEQMSYSGRNFDVVSGATAVVVAALLWSGRVGRAVATAWNALGVVLLANILMIAILSTPRFEYFGPDRVNVFVTYPPFVWLPAVLVLAALVGHLLIFRALSGKHGPSANNRSHDFR